MNKKEKELLSELYWWLSEYKNEHHVIYYAKDVLQSIIRGELKIAENLLMPKATASMTVPPKQSEDEEYWATHCRNCGAELS